MSLQDFLNSNLVTDLTEDVAVSTRFKDKDGNLLKFKIKAMSNPDFNDLRKSCTEVKKNRKVEFDSHRFNLRMIINHTVVPDFKHAESIQKLGLHTPEEYVESTLLAGEVTTLASKIQELSGFDVDMSALVDEAKN
ncbi:XkdN-like protein [Paenibacillus pinisoli]|uniref:XkdN-like protein n=1 Tax=Paenibacillus pinisoli TaxID=1276110 RepID=A0A3A6PRI9_9BACL|nr:XkdN-like protein [Paenibacillus pinisoli]RJX40869.1 XkdN-like protein [Paenibacillus pinisoli]